MEILYDIREILKRVPHRFPFVMVDRILELVPNENVVALKNVTFNEPYFPGHFPNYPVMPGVLIIEGMGQAGVVLVSESQPEERRNIPIFFMAMEKMKFRKPVVPGDQLIYNVRIIQSRAGKTYRLHGTASVDGYLVAEGVFMATFGENL